MHNKAFEYSQKDFNSFKRQTQKQDVSLRTRFLVYDVWWKIQDNLDAIEGRFQFKDIKNINWKTTSYLLPNY